MADIACRMKNCIYHMSQFCECKDHDHDECVNSEKVKIDDWNGLAQCYSYSEVAGKKEESYCTCFLPERVVSSPIDTVDTCKFCGKIIKDGLI